MWQDGLAAGGLQVVLPVSAAAAPGRGVTYGGRSVRGGGGHPGGGGVLGGDGGGGEARAGAVPLAEVPLALADQRLLVALHPLQLLLRGHSPSRLAARELRGFCGGGQALQGTLRSLLVRQGGRTDTMPGWKQGGDGWLVERIKSSFPFS